MKIAFISSGKLPVSSQKGGAVENLILQLCKENEKTKKHDYTVFSLWQEGIEEENSNWKYTTFEYIPMQSFTTKCSRYIRYVCNRLPNVYVGNAYIHLVKKKLKDTILAYDYVIIENAPEFALSLVDIAKGKLILHLHNDFLHVDTKLAHKIIACYDKIWTLSHYIQDRVEEIEGQVAKIDTLYNGIEIEKFGQEQPQVIQQQWREKFQILPDQTVLLYTGRLVPEKGVKELIQAFQQSKSHTQAKLLIAGSVSYGTTCSSPYIEELKMLTQQDPNICFTGFIDYKQIPILYAISDIGVIPSVWEEPFALTVIENLAAGNPVIISNSGGMKELVTPECGCIVEKGQHFVTDLGEAIDSLILNQDKTNRLRLHTKKRAALFTSQNYCKRFQELLMK